MPRRRWYQKNYDMEFSQSEIFEEDANKEQDYFPFTFFAGTENAVTHFLPNDILEYILLYIPAYPYYFSLRRVGKQWLEELEQRIYFRVEHLDLIPRFQDDTIRFKPFLQSGYTQQVEDLKEAFKCVVKCFPNTKHITSFCVTQIVDKTELFFNMCKQFSKLEHLSLFQNAFYHFSKLDFSAMPHLKRVDLINFHRMLRIFFSKKTDLELRLLSCDQTVCNDIRSEIKEQTANVTITQEINTFVRQCDEKLILEQLKFCYDTQHIPLCFQIACGQKFEDLLAWSNSSNILTYLLEKGYKLDRKVFVTLLQHSKLVDPLLALCKTPKTYLLFSLKELDTAKCTVLLNLLDLDCSNEVLEKAYQIGLPWYTKWSVNPFAYMVSGGKREKLQYLIDHCKESIPIPKNLIQTAKQHYMFDTIDLIWTIQKDISSLKELAWQERNLQFLDYLTTDCPLDSFLEDISEQLVLDMITKNNYYSNRPVDFLLKLEEILGKETLYTKQWLGKNLIQLVVSYPPLRCDSELIPFTFFKERVEWLKKPMTSKQGNELLLSFEMDMTYIVALHELIDLNQIDPQTGNTRLMQLFSQPDMKSEALKYCEYVSGLLHGNPPVKLDFSIQNKLGKNLPYLLAAALFPLADNIEFRQYDNIQFMQYSSDFLRLIPLPFWLQKAENEVCALKILLHTQLQSIATIILDLPNVEELFEQQVGMPVLHFLIDSLPSITSKYLSFVISKLKNPQSLCERMQGKPNALQFALSKSNITVDTLKTLLKSITWNKKAVNSDTQSYLEIALCNIQSLEILIKNEFDLLEQNDEILQKKLLSQAMDKQSWDCGIIIMEHFGKSCITEMQQIVTILQHKIQKEMNYNYNKLFKQLTSILTSDNFFETLVSKEMELLENDKVSLLLFAYYHLESTFIKQIAQYFKHKLQIIFEQQSQNFKNNIMHIMALRQVTSESNDFAKYKLIVNQIVKEKEDLLFEINANGDTCFHLMCQNNTDLLFYLLDHKKALCVKGLEMKNTKGVLPLDLIKDTELRSSVEMAAYPKRKKEIAQRLLGENQSESDTSMGEASASRRGVKRGSAVLAAKGENLEEDDEPRDKDEYVPEEQEKVRRQPKRKRK